MKKLRTGLLAIPAPIIIAIFLFLGLLFVALIVSIVQYLENCEMNSLMIVVTTLGVIINIGAMIALIFTLIEQKEVNNKLAMNRIEDNFYLKIDKFMSLLKEKSESSKYVENPNEQITCAKYLTSKWNSEIRDQLLNLILNEDDTFIIDDSTEIKIDKLKEIAMDMKDGDIKRISLNIHDILISKNKLLKLDENAYNAIEVNWCSIHNIWKVIAGFYFTWTWTEVRPKTKEEEGLYEFFEREISQVYPHESIYRIIRPEWIPIIVVSNEEEKQSTGFNKQKICIHSKNEIQINQVELVGKESEIAPNHFVEKKIESEKYYSYSLEDLFGDDISNKIDEIFNKEGMHGIQSSVDKELTLVLSMNITYNGKKWKYKKQIEFIIYNDHKTSIICKTEQI